MAQYKHYLTEALYYVAIYVRLSRDDEDKNKEQSESITNQIEFLTNYVLENGWAIVDIYSDDGISGTTFNRPDFQRMLNDIENGKINMVVTKDLSRLGRDYIQTGYYLENYFPLKKVRYIAVNDGFDTFKEDGANDFVPFKSVFNDMYAKDISKKVRTTFKTKQLKGEYLGTIAPFGYLKDPEQKGHLIIDPVSSKYVALIFEKYLEGIPLMTITNELIKEKIPTPSQYGKLASTQKRIEGLWNDKTVRFILKNEVYIGHTVQNKRKKISYKINREINNPRSQWIKVENTHEPIISKEDFNMVQQVLHIHSFTPPKGKPHLLTGLAICGHCGTPISFMNRHETGKFYTVCSTAKRHSKLNLCKMHLMKEEVVENSILNVLREIAEEFINPVNLISLDTEKNTLDLIAGKEKQKAGLLNCLERAKDVYLNLYKDKVSGVISQSDFDELSQGINNEKQDTVNRIQKLDKEINELQNNNNDDDYLKNVMIDFLKFNHISRNVLCMLVEKVVLYNDDTMDIYLNFKEPVKKNLAKINI